MSLILRTCAKDGTSYGNFRWPLTVGAIVEAPDWDHIPRCGNGLHGALHGEGDGGLFNWSADAVWMVVEADDDWIIDLGGKVKFPACVIRHVGDQRSATGYIMAHDPLARVVIGACVTSGHSGTSTSGDRGTSTSGDGGTSTSGYGGILQIKWYDGSRYRIATAYVGENGILPNTPYRLDRAGNFVRADK